MSDGDRLLLDVAQGLLDDPDGRAVIELVRLRQECAEANRVVREQSLGQACSERVRIGRVDSGLVHSDERGVAALLQEPVRVAQLEDALAKRVAGERLLPRDAGERGLRLQLRRAGDPAAAREGNRTRELVEPRQHLRAVDALAQLLGRRQRGHEMTPRKSSRNPCVSKSSTSVQFGSLPVMPSMSIEL
jgi:hypothetical protein